MKILIATTVELPDLCSYYKHSVSNFSGWVWQSISELKRTSTDIEIGILYSSNSNKYEEIQVETIKYYVIPCKSQNKYDSNCEKYCRTAIQDFNPDIIHINGTEFSFSLCVLNASNKNIPIVASIQGLASVYYRYIDGDLKFWNFIFNVGLKDILLFGTQRFMRKLMKQRGEIEIELITKLKYIIGRTTWDKFHSLSINPDINYSFCNETLRPSFYTKKWNFMDCEKHSIFVSNGTTALKGVHIAIKALSIVKKEFPNSKLYIVGKNPFKANNFIERIKVSSYENYLKKLIIKLDLTENVCFLGFLKEDEMCDQFLKANVFVLPSCIENSPNSLGEAQLVGTPCIASYNGGVPDMIVPGKTGYMYRFEEYEMLAQYIINVFKSGNNQMLSESERAIAAERHNRVVNGMQLYKIFSQIINDTKK